MNSNLAKFLGVVVVLGVFALLVKQICDLTNQTRNLAFAGAQLLVQNNQLSLENKSLSAELDEVKSTERKVCKGFLS